LGKPRRSNAPHLKATVLNVRTTTGAFWRRPALERAPLRALALALGLGLRLVVLALACALGLGRRQAL
jgi:hypothetical protein